MTPLSSQGTQQPLTAAPPPPKQSPYRTFLERQGARILANGGSISDVHLYMKHAEDLPGVEHAILGGASLPAVPAGPAGPAQPEVPGSAPPAGFDIEAPGPLRGMSQRAMQTLMFGTSDEALGAIAGFAAGRPVGDGIDTYKAELAKFADESPWLGRAGDVVGTALQLAIARKAFGPSVLENPVKVGAVMGAAQGFGEGEGGITERAQNALFGAGVGAGTMGLLGIAAKALSPITKVVAQKTANKVVEWAPLIAAKLGTAASRARALLAHAIEREGSNIDDMIVRAQDGAAQGLRQTIADLSQPEGHIEGLGQAALSVRGAVKKETVQQYLGRQVDQGYQMLDRLFRVTKPGFANAYDADIAIAAAQKAAADPLYLAAHQEMVPTPEALRQLMNLSATKQDFVNVWNSGRMTAAREDAAAAIGAGPKKGLPVPMLHMDDAGDVNLPDMLPVRGLDYMKQALDEIIAAKAEGNVLGIRDAHSLNISLQKVLEEASTNSVNYAKARSIFRGHAELRDALKLGKEGFSRKVPEVVTKELGSLVNPSDPGHTANLHGMYRVGVIQHLHDIINAPTDEFKDVARQYFGGSLMKRGEETQAARRIRALFPNDPDMAQSFMDHVASQARMSDVVRKFRGTPAPTFGGGPAASQFVPFRPSLWSAAAAAGRIVINRAQTGWTEAVSDELANLFAKGLKDPNELVALLHSLKAVNPKPNRAASTVLGSLITRSVLRQ